MSVPENKQNQTTFPTPERQALDTYNAYAAWDADNLEIVNDFDNLLGSIEAVKKHFHRGQLPIVLEETKNISIDFMLAALQKMNAIEVKDGKTTSQTKNTN